MALGSIAITGTITGLTGGSRTIAPPVISSTAAVDNVRTIALAGNTNTTIDIPTGAVACVITPPPSNTAQLTFKGVAGDTGLRISRSHPTMIALETLTPSVPTTFVLYAQSPGISVEVAFV